MLNTSSNMELQIERVQTSILLTPGQVFQVRVSLRTNTRRPSTEDRAICRCIMKLAKDVRRCCVEVLLCTKLVRCNGSLRFGVAGTYPSFDEGHDNSILCPSLGVCGKYILSFLIHFISPSLSRQLLLVAEFNPSYLLFCVREHLWVENSKHGDYHRNRYWNNTSSPDCTAPSPWT